MSDDNVNALGFADSSIAGISDAGFLTVKTNGSNVQFVSVARRQSMHNDGKGKKKSLWFDALMEHYYYNLNNPELSPYNLNQPLTQFAPTDYTQGYELDGVVLPASLCIGSIWAQTFMINLKKTGWYKLLKEMRKDDLQIVEELNEDEWFELANSYGIELTQEDLDFLMGEYEQNPYDMLLEATHE